MNAKICILISDKVCLRLRRSWKKGMTRSILNLVRNLTLRKRSLELKRRRSVMRRRMLQTEARMRRTGVFCY